MYIRIHIYIYYIIIYLYSPKLRTKYSKTNRQITNMLPTVNPPQFPTKVQYEHPLLGFSEIGYPKKKHCLSQQHLLLQSAWLWDHCPKGHSFHPQVAPQRSSHTPQFCSKDPHVSKMFHDLFESVILIQAVSF